MIQSHDMTRVIQWMLKLGSASVRSAVCEELCSNTVLYLKSKYASFCILKALKYGSKHDRDHIIQSCNGNFLTLLSYSVSGIYEFSTLFVLHSKLYLFPFLLILSLNFSC